MGREQESIIKRFYSMFRLEVEQNIAFMLNNLFVWEHITITKYHSGEKKWLPRYFHFVAGQEALGPTRLRNKARLKKNWRKENGLSNQTAANKRITYIFYSYILFIQWFAISLALFSVLNILQFIMCEYWHCVYILVRCATFKNSI